MLIKSSDIIITCAAGLEPLVQEEALGLGAVIKDRTAGAVAVQGPLEIAYRMCLWSRYASRVMLALAEFPAPDSDGLYKGVQSVSWDRHFGLKETFAVDCTRRRHAAIQHSGFAALRVKDAVVDQFRAGCGDRPPVDADRPQIRIHLLLKGEQGTVCLDLSGESLHRRGYRSRGGAAPLKENLAAAILHYAGWPPPQPEGAVLLDPVCGSGTLLTEAALMHAGRAPGGRRENYGFLKWRGHRKGLWERLLKEAGDQEESGARRPAPRIIGYDSDRAAVRGAVENAGRMGLEKLIHVERRDLAQLENPLCRKRGAGPGRGLLVVNPPYGERMGSHAAVRYLYRCLGRKLREHFCGWQAAIFSGGEDVLSEVGMDCARRYRLYNGTIACKLCVYEVPAVKAPRHFTGFPIESKQVPGEAADFANRIKKNMRHLSRWARDQGVSCYRIYDADIPEYNVAVDLYDQWVHVQEYAPPKTVDPKKAAERLSLVLRGLQAVLGIGRDKIYVKVRQKQKGRAQYQKLDGRERFCEVREGDCRLLVNLTDYLDTGLFLDHRSTRGLIRKIASGRRFLNLFGYTGAATVCAAAGGAGSTVTVDLSPVYLDWARSNLALNGFSESNHLMVRADCMGWLEGTHEQFDLIFADPPTFSNSKRLKTIFDVQRDHAELIRRAMRRLEPGGVLLFSNNFKRFQMDEAVSREFDVRNITRQTLPPDFARNPKVHGCWEVRRKQPAFAVPATARSAL